MMGSCDLHLHGKADTDRMTALAYDSYQHIEASL